MTSQQTSREALFAYENSAYAAPRGLAGLFGGLCLWILAVTLVATNLA